jgi:hypothetical protein
MRLHLARLDSRGRKDCATQDLDSFMRPADDRVQRCEQDEWWRRRRPAGLSFANRVGGNASSDYADRDQDAIPASDGDFFGRVEQGFDWVGDVEFSGYDDGGCERGRRGNGRGDWRDDSDSAIRKFFRIDADYRDELQCMRDAGFDRGYAGKSDSSSEYDATVGGDGNEQRREHMRHYGPGDVELFDDCESDSERWRFSEGRCGGIGNDYGDTRFSDGIDIGYGHGAEHHVNFSDAG